MKPILLLITSFLLVSCNPSPNRDNHQISAPTNDTLNDGINSGSQNEQGSKRFCQDQIQTIFEKATCYALNETITADFNGDDYLDQATLAAEGEDKVISILDGQSKTVIKFGPGHPLAGFGEDFNWIGYWGVLYDSVSYEIIVQDSEVIGDTLAHLPNPAIFLRQSEAGGGLIAFRDNAYQWIHQTD